MKSDRFIFSAFSFQFSASRYLVRRFAAGIFFAVLAAALCGRLERELFEPELFERREPSEPPEPTEPAELLPFISSARSTIF